MSRGGDVQVSKKLRLIAVGAALALGLVACGGSGAGGGSGSSENSNPKDVTIGVAMPTQTSERWIADGNNVKKQLEDKGYKVDLQYANDDIPTQSQQIDQMITKGDKVLVVAAIDGTALSSQLQAAADAGIKVISYDRLIRDSKNVDFYVSFDNYKVGVAQANALLRGLGVVDKDGKPTGEKGPFNIELFAGSLDNGVLSPYDGLSRGIITALQNAGYGPKIDSSPKPMPIVTGQDAEIASVKLIADGVQSSTIFKDTRLLAEQAVAAAAAFAEGKEPEANDTKTYDNGVKVVPSYLLPVETVYADNIQSALVDSGYWTADEVAKGQAD